MHYTSFLGPYMLSQKTAERLLEVYGVRSDCICDYSVELHRQELWNRQTSTYCLSARTRPSGIGVLSLFNAISYSAQTGEGTSGDTTQASANWTSQESECRSVGGWA